MKCTSSGRMDSAQRSTGVINAAVSVTTAWGRRASAMNVSVSRTWEKGMARMTRSASSTDRGRFQSPLSMAFLREATRVRSGSLSCPTM